jgi:hypothetical protein
MPGQTKSAGEVASAAISHHDNLLSIAERLTIRATVGEYSLTRIALEGRVVEEEIDLVALQGRMSGSERDELANLLPELLVERIVGTLPIDWIGHLEAH